MTDIFYLLNYLGKNCGSAKISQFKDFSSQVDARFLNSVIRFRAQRKKGLLANDITQALIRLNLITS